MDLVLVFILFFGGIFTVSFGLAWAIPMATTAFENRLSKSESRSPLKDVADILLILHDLIPIFLIFDIFKQAPEDYSAAKKKWKNEGSIRASFYLSITSGIATVSANYFLFIV